MSSEKPSTQIGLQTSETGPESFSATWADQTIQEKLDLQLYLHFQRFLQKSKDHYSEDSSFFGKKVSKEKNVNETIKYFNYLKQNIEPLPHDHHQQLLLLIDIFNCNNKLITNRYLIDSVYKDSTGPTKFKLIFNRMNERIDWYQFLSFNNWNHLVSLSFWWCHWFNDDDWRTLVEHAGNFNNLKELHLSKNNISVIKEGDIEQFKSLKYIGLQRNPLSRESKEVLRRLQQSNTKMQIGFNE